MRGQVLRAAERVDVRRDPGQCGLVALDQVDAAQEGQHGQAAAVPRGAAGGKHVVGTREVVAEGYGGVGADEDSARVADPAREPCFKVAQTDEEMTKWEGTNSEVVRREKLHRHMNNETGAMEIAAHDASGTYRTIHTVSIGESIYAIHAFQKKSTTGIATPKPEMELIRQRLKQLRTEVKNAEKRNA